MDSMSHDPQAGDIGSQLVDIGSQGISAGTTAGMSVLSGLIPAGGEEVSAQAVLAFAQEAASMLASNTMAQEELMRTGTALTDIARMYGDADVNAAGGLALGGASATRAMAGGSGANVGAGLLRAGALPGQAAGAPLMSQLVEASSSPMVSTAASAGSSAMGGAAPMGSGMGGAGAPAAGASKPGLASATGPGDEDDRQRDEQSELQPGERLT